MSFHGRVSGNDRRIEADCVRPGTAVGGRASGRPALRASGAALLAVALAGYRQTVLAAFKEVKDALAGIALRTREAAAQAEALAAAARIAELARARCEAGAGTYLESADAERSRLRHERLRVRLDARRLSTGVLLVKALGGGWESSAAR